MTLPAFIGDLGVPAVDRRRLGTALVVIAVVAIAVGVSPGASREPSVEQSLLLAAIAVVVLGPTAVVVAARRFDLFSAQTIFAAAFGVMFLARPVAMLYSNNFSWPIANSPVPNVPVPAEFAASPVLPGFTTMLAAALLGALAFQAGFFLRRPAATVQPSPKIDWDSRFLFRCAVGLGIVGTLLFGAFVVQSSRHQGLSTFLHGRSSGQAALYKSSTAYLYDGMFLLAPATLLLVASLAYGSGLRRRLARPIAVLFGVLLLLSSFPTGNRTALLVLLGALFAFYFLRRHTRPALVVSLVVVVVGFYALSTVRDLRDAGARQQGRGQAVLAVFEHPGRQLGLLFNRGDTSMASALALETEIVPTSLHYRYGGATLGDLFIRPIPHLLWKGKPLAPEDALTKQLWLAAFTAGAAHPVYSVMGTFYFDLGLLGVVVGMVFVGVAYGWIDARLLRSRDEGVILILAAILPLLVLGLRDSLPDTIIHAVFIVLPLVVATALARRRGVGPNAAAEPAPGSG